MSTEHDLKMEAFAAHLERERETADLERLKRAAITVANILDAGERDPTWHESQELEEAAIAYGRSVRREQVTKD